MTIGKKKVRRTARERRKLRIRKAILGNSDRYRLSVFKSSKYTYAQIISDQTGKTVVAASTKDAEVASSVKAEDKQAKSSKSVAAAFAMGEVLGKRANEKNISAVVFDRNGFLFHGRIKAVADGARKAGSQF